MVFLASASPSSDVQVSFMPDKVSSTWLPLDLTLICFSTLPPALLTNWPIAADAVVAVMALHRREYRGDCEAECLGFMHTHQCSLCSRRLATEARASAGPPRLVFPLAVRNPRRTASGPLLDLTRAQGSALACVVVQTQGQR